MTRVVFFALACILAGETVAAADATSASPGWRDRCAPDEITKRQMCAAYRVENPGDSTRFAALFVTPLAHGTYRVQVSAGAETKWNDAEIQIGTATATAHCKGTTCTFGEADSTKLVGQMVAGADARVRFRGSAASGPEIAISLTGFADALRAARDRTPH